MDEEANQQARQALWRAMDLSGNREHSWTRFEALIGAGRGQPKQWLNGTSGPPAWALIAAARAVDRSVDELLGQTDAVPVSRDEFEHLRRTILSLENRVNQYIEDGVSSSHGADREAARRSEREAG